MQPPSRQEPVYVPPEGPPKKIPSKEIYAAMGRENIFRMCEDFYRELEKSEIRSLFPEDMVAASRKNAAFFVGMLGGPPLYQELYGSPRMRARHLHVVIDEQARRTWVDCFRRTLDHAVERYSFPPEHLPGFIEFLEGFSAWMVNSQEESGAEA
jgi:hemoglobin